MQVAKQKCSVYISDTLPLCCGHSDCTNPDICTKQGHSKANGKLNINFFNKRSGLNSVQRKNQLNCQSATNNGVDYRGAVSVTETGENMIAPPCSQLTDQRQQLAAEM